MLYSLKIFICLVNYYLYIQLARMEYIHTKHLIYRDLKIKYIN